MSDQSIFETFENITAAEVVVGSAEMGSLDEKIDKPYWKIDKNKLLEALTPFKVLAGISNSNVVAKSVFLHNENQVLKMRGNDKDAYVWRSLPIENSENLMNEGFALNVSDLDLLVRGGYSKVLLYKDGDQVKMRVFGGDFLLDPINVGAYLYDYDKLPKPTDYKTLAFEEFQSLVSVMFNSMKLAVRPEDKKVIVADNNAYGSFLVSAVRVPVRGIKSSVFRVIDLMFLKVLLTNQSVVSFAETPERYFFNNDGFTLSTLKSNVPVEDIKKSLDLLFDAKRTASANIDFHLIKSIVGMISRLSNTTGLVDLESDNGAIRLSYLTKTNKRSSFKVGDGQLSEKQTLSLDSIKRNFSLIDAVPSVQLHSTKSGLILEDKGIQILVGIKT